jgi:hypothetical protein
MTGREVDSGFRERPQQLWEPGSTSFLYASITGSTWRSLDRSMT